MFKFSFKSSCAILLFLFCNISFAIATTLATDEVGNNKEKDKLEVVQLIKRSKEKKGVRPAESLAAAEEALALAQKIQDTVSIINSLNQLGRVYNYMEYNEKAMEVLLNAVDLCQKKNLKKEESASYNELGGVFYNQADYKMAEKYFSKSLDIRLFLDSDKVAISASLNNVGETYRLKGDNKTALEYYKRALAINEKLGLKTSIAANCANIGYIYLSEDKFPLAFEFFTKGNETAISGGDPKDLANPLINLGLYYLKTGEPAKAVDYFTKGLHTAEKVYQRLDQIDAVKGLSDAYEKLGDHKNAYAYLNEFYRKRDSVQSVDKERKLLEMDLKFETIEKEKKLERSQTDKKVDDLNDSKQNVLNYLLTGGVIFLGAIGTLLFYANRRRKRSKSSS